MGEKQYLDLNWECLSPREYRLGMDGTRWRIFCCAIHFFAVYDYTDVSMREIAGHVGIRAASIYNHFASKDDILAHMYEFGEHFAAMFPLGLEDVSQSLQQEPASALLRDPRRFYPWPLHKIMSKILLVCSKRMRFDNRADALLKRILIDQPTECMDLILERLQRMGRIEADHIDAFRLLYGNQLYGAALRMYSGQAMGEDGWTQSMELLCSLLELKHP